MEKIKIEVEVSKPVYELGLEIKGLTADIAKALEDGFQAGTDLMPILLPRITRLGELKAMIAAIPEELKAPWDVVQALTASLEGIEAPFIKKPAQP